MKVENCLAGHGQRRRYLFVINELGFIYSHFWHLALAIQEAGWEVVIASAAVSDPERALQAGMKFYRIQPTFGIGNPLSELRSGLELRRAIRAIRPDIIHTVSLKNVLLGGVLARTERVPALLSAVTGLGTMFVEDRALYRFLKPAVFFGLRHVHRRKRSVMAFENPDDQQYFVDEDVIPPNRSFLIPGAGLDPDAITPGPKRDWAPVIVCVGRMIRSKGILELIEAAKLMRGQGLRFELHLAGDIDPRNPTSLSADDLQKIQKEGIAHWLGRRSDVPSLLRSANIFCSPTYYREGMPRSLIEASAAGLPIVTSDVPGCREVVANEVNGFLVPPRDISALAEKLGQLIQSNELRERMGRASRARFEENFTTAHVLGAFNRCYATLDIPLVLGVAAAR
jgi:glycosyltransferase involved in cell wall biosynthesis